MMTATDVLVVFLVCGVLVYLIHWLYSAVPDTPSPAVPHPSSPTLTLKFTAVPRVLTREERRVLNQRL